MDLTYSFMLPILVYFAKATQSYGWALVLLTLLVRVILWPLVSKQTTSMQRMSQLQPMMNQIKERYKDEPEMFQKKAMEFYAKNKVNPMGGCLPMLLQLPIFFALFATFSGPPFGDKPIMVNVKVVDQANVREVKETAGGNMPYVSPSGELSKIAVFPGEAKISQGESIEYGSRVLEGAKVPSDFHPIWKVYKGQAEAPAAEATIDENGHATFNKVGDYTIYATIPGVAKDESFGLVTGLGKVASGLQFLEPKNWDALFLVLAFGLSMYVSQKFTTTSANKPKPGEPIDEQTRIQQDTMKILPLVMTATFFFIPLPVGVLIYIVLSNIVQSFQTWMLMKRPVPPLVSVLDDIPADFKDVTPPDGTPTGGGGKKSKGDKGGSSDSNGKGAASKKDGGVINTGDNGKGHKLDIGNTSSDALPASDFKRKSKKKKKK